MNTKSLLIGGLTLIAGCAAPPPPPPMDLQTHFNAEEHQRFMKHGSATIRGQGFLRQQGGGVVTCAGYPVQLIPATPYFREVVHQLRIGRRPGPGQSLDSYREYFKRSTCDAQGNFDFENLPAGDWFVMTEVRWTVANMPQGGVLLREVTAEDHDVAQVLLSDSDFFGR
ncbi:MAG TPA: hypothetical protein VN782_15950 [Usitatibacter sp.]|nr:hypothetical protein [Usitatibacter sp.]